MPIEKDIVQAIQAKRTSSGTSPIDAENRAKFFSTPFIMTTKARLSQGETRSIAFRCGPSEVDYEFPQRGSSMQVKEGRVFFYYRNEKGTHWDTPKITWTFQSGNIRPMVERGDQIYLPEGLSNVYEYLSIIDEVKTLADGTPNYVVIQHRSHLFPKLYLEGFFDPDEPDRLKESAEGTTNITWTRTFIVVNSFPAFNSDAFRSIFQNNYVSDMTETLGETRGVKNTRR